MPAARPAHPFSRRPPAPVTTVGGTIIPPNGVAPAAAARRDSLSFEAQPRPRIRKISSHPVSTRPRKATIDYSDAHPTVANPTVVQLQPDPPTIQKSEVLLPPPPAAPAPEPAAFKRPPFIHANKTARFQPLHERDIDFLSLSPDPPSLPPQPRPHPVSAIMTAQAAVYEPNQGSVADPFPASEPPPPLTYTPPPPRMPSMPEASASLHVPEPTIFRKQRKSLSRYRQLTLVLSIGFAFAVGLAGSFGYQLQQSAARGAPIARETRANASIKESLALGGVDAKIVHEASPAPSASISTTKAPPVRRAAPKKKAAEDLGGRDLLGEGLRD